MAKALRVFVVLGLLLSIGALVLGILLFQQREQLRGRTEKLEENVLSVFQALTSPREPFIQAIPERLDRELLRVYDDPENPNLTMDVQLSRLRAIVANRYDELFDTYNDLKTERDAHAATRAELARTRQELADTRAELARTQQQLEQTRQQLAQARQQIGELETQVAGLEAQVEDFKFEVASHQETIRSQEDEIIRLRAQLGFGEGDITEVPAVAGKVLLVNPEWNFVVVDLGREDKLLPNVEMIVHRGEQMIGRVRISAVMDRISVAEIERDWQQIPIQEGDRVFN